MDRGLKRKIETSTKPPKRRNLENPPKFAEIGFAADSEI
jgi:hypothetical protein